MANRGEKLIVLGSSGAARPVDMAGFLAQVRDLATFRRGCRPLSASRAVSRAACGVGSRALQLTDISLRSAPRLIGG